MAVSWDGEPSSQKLPTFLRSRRASIIKMLSHHPEDLARIKTKRNIHKCKSPSQMVGRRTRLLQLGNAFQSRDNSTISRSVPDLGSQWERNRKYNNFRKYTVP